MGFPFTVSVAPVRFTAPEQVMVTRFCSKVPFAVNAPTLMPPEDLLNFSNAPLLTVTALFVGSAPVVATIKAPFWINVAPS